MRRPRVQREPVLELDQSACDRIEIGGGLPGDPAGASALDEGVSRAGERDRLEGEERRGHPVARRRRGGVGWPRAPHRRRRALRRPAVKQTAPLDGPYPWDAPVPLVRQALYRANHLVHLFLADRATGGKSRIRNTGPKGIHAALFSTRQRSSPGFPLQPGGGAQPHRPPPRDLRTDRDEARRHPRRRPRGKMETAWDNVIAILRRTDMTVVISSR